MRVACGECGNPYDDGVAFCPRCGSTKRGDGKELPPVHDPRRRRVQMAGVLFLVLGGILAVLAGSFAVTSVAAPDATRDAMAASMAGVTPGGTLNLTVTVEGRPVEALVVVLSPTGIEAMRGTTNATTGRLSLDLKEAPAVEVRASAGARNVTARYVVVVGQHRDATLDLAAPSSATWQGLPLDVGVIATVAWVLTGIFLLLFASGILAMRLRHYAAAWSMALPMTLASALVAFASLNPSLLLAFGLVATGLAIIVAGRSAFR